MSKKGVHGTPTHTFFATLPYPNLSRHFRVMTGLSKFILNSP